MKNRRLNILFIALIALAAAPQALKDVRALAGAAQERAESEFWSIFLSYQSPDGQGGDRAAVRGTLLARTETKSACPLERGGEIQPELVRSAQSKPDAQGQARPRASAEARRAGAPAEEDAPAVDDDEAVANAKALKASEMHSRDSERIASAAQKAALASFVDENGNVQIRFKQLMEMDKLLRQKNRSTRDRDRLDARLPPVPNPGDNM